ncbi:hypothetical protein Tco_1191478 [Tanacetum coccineum]
MANPVISISSDSADESVGSSISRAILFSSIPIEVPIIPTDLPVAPEVGAAVVASPASVLELDTYSSSKSDTEFPVSMYHLHTMSYGVARWRSRSCIMTISPSGSQHNTTYTSEIPTAPILPAPPTIDILVGRLYRTHPGGPCRALTVRKMVGPLPSNRLALRYTSHDLDRFTSGSSSDHSSSDHSSSDHSSADHSLADHTLGHSILD